MNNGPLPENSVHEYSSRPLLLSSRSEDCRWRDRGPETPEHQEPRECFSNRRGRYGSDSHCCVESHALPPGFVNALFTKLTNDY